MLLNASAQLKFLNSHGSEGSNAERSKTSLFCGVPQYPYQLGADQAVFSGRGLLLGSLRPRVNDTKFARSWVRKSTPLAF